MSQYEAFFSLIRKGIGHYIIERSTTYGWSEIQALACRHGLSAIVLDGIKCVPEDMHPEKGFLLQWIGEVLQCYEQRYELYCRAIAEMAAFYNSHGYKMMVLKGFACGLDWPKPEHRPYGDIDIWLFGKQNEADIVLTKEKGIKIDKSHHHHTVFNWRAFAVENHYDFINVHHHKSNVAFEKVLKELGKDDNHSVMLYGEKVYLPSPNLHALFLLKHLMMHFAAEGITLRQLLDWGLFVEGHSTGIDWAWLDRVLSEYGMKSMFHIFTAICVEDMGFDANLFPSIQFQPALKERVLKDIMEPKDESGLPENVFRRMTYKWGRWTGSMWKHNLCYKDSIWSAFWSGVWNHLLKPSYI